MRGRPSVKNRRAESKIFIEQTSEIAGELVVEYTDQGVGMSGLDYLEKSLESMIQIVLMDQARDGALRERGELDPERAAHAVVEVV